MTNYTYPCAVKNVSDSFTDHVNRGSVNPGTDYTAAYGDAVSAVAAGVVTDASNSPSGGGGRTIHVDHDDGSGADYLHLSSLNIAAGARVSQGQLIARSGASGYGSDWYYGPHLHISFRYNHAHGYGNNGNVDFDAIMRSQKPPTPPPPPPAQWDYWQEHD
jgi:murein DD-endopeptidase